MDGLKKNVLILLVIIQIANIFAYPRTYRPSNKIQDEVPTKKALLENYNDFGLDQSISDYPDNQVCVDLVDFFKRLFHIFTYTN